MAATISSTRFAELVQDRLIDAFEVARLAGYRNKQSVYNAVTRGVLPEPVLKAYRNYAFWDRDAVEAHISKRR